MQPSKRIGKFFFTFLVFVCFSCKNNFEQVKQLNQFDALPVGVADTIRVVYTDSAQTVAILKAPKNIDFTNQPFPYSEFPIGVEVVFFDENNKETFVRADYGIMYNRTNLVDLRGNVRITTPEGADLQTSQLYWDVDREWVFTQENFTFKNKDYHIAAKVLDASRSFNRITTGPLTGSVAVEEEL